MRIQTTAVLLIGSLAFFCLGCGSLLGETERIRAAYVTKNPLTVTQTDPADNSIAPYNQTYIDVSFSGTIDTGTISAQSQFGACSGALQVSYDGFTNCLGGTIDSSANPRIRFTPTIFPKGLGLQIKITNAVISSLDVPATPYTSSVGFKLGAPCGGFNCFFSYSTPLMTVAGTRSGIFAIRTGTHAGKYLVYSSSGTSTTMIDPVTVTSVSGPTLPASCLPGDGSHNFYIGGGTTNAGKQAIIRGGNNPDWCLYDPSTHLITTGPALPLNPGGGSFSLQPVSGSDTDKIFVPRGSATSSFLRYDYTSESFTNVSASFIVTGSISLAAHALRLQTGMNAGRWFIVNGSAAPGTGTWLFSESPAGLATSTALGQAAGAGSSSFEVTSTTPGAERIVTVLGGNTFAVSVMSTATFGAPVLQNSALTGAVGSGGQLLRQANTNSYDAPLILHGGPAYTTSIYSSASGTFSAGPVTTGVIADGSAAVFVPSATNGGAFLIANGNGLPSTSVYFPATNTFSGTRTPTNVPNPGSNYFAINGGAKNGRTMIVSGALSAETAVFDPLRFEMTRGPQLQGGNASANSFNLPLATSNRVLVFIGNSIAYNIYDPNTDTFATTGGPTLGTATGQAAVAFTRPGTSNIIVMHGGGATSGEMFDEANFASAPVAVTSLCAIGAVPFTLRYANLAAVQLRQLVFCSGTTMGRFNLTGGVFLSSLTLMGGGGTGIQGFTVSGGIHNGKILLIHGGGSSTSTLIDPTTDPETISAGPSLTPGCATLPNAGAQIMPLTTGVNAGRVVLVTGNTNADTCMYDPVSASFIAGPKVGSGVGFQVTGGSLAFRTNGGVYPTSFILLSGSNKNVWSTYVP